MNFTHLRAFYAIVNNGSFTQAADELQVSQPTLSMQLQSLEKYCGLPLLKRIRKKLELTKEGEILYTYAKRLFDLASEMENSIKDFKTLQTEKFNVGSTQLFAHYMLPDILLKLKEALPGLKLQITTGLSRDILNKVVNFECHIGMIGRVAYPGNVIFKQISKQKLYFITVEKMKSPIHLEDLSNYPLIMRENGSATREYIIKQFAHRKILLNNRINSQNPSAIKRMVQLGMGGAFFPAYAIEEEVKAGKFRQIEILEDLYISIDLIYLLERKKLKPIQDIVSAVTRYDFLQIEQRYSQSILISAGCVSDAEA
ncbi:MAG: LysR family transcriptional regulator [Syntrophaceae bacterium]|nr:LysR family transcriptional regulator [Syntrophaceae bacterium]